MKKTERYAGILAKPMASDWWHGLPPERVIERTQALLSALLDHFGIKSDDPQRMDQLAIRLAMAHVPAFQVKEKSGRKQREWSLSQQVELLQFMEDELSSGRTIESAVKALTGKGKPYAGKASLRRRYEEARDNPVAVQFAHLMKERSALSTDDFVARGVAIIKENARK